MVFFANCPLLWVSKLQTEIALSTLHSEYVALMLYLASNTRPDISFAVHQCTRFTHNTKVSHETAVKRICRYLQGTKENGLVFNPSKKLVVDCYADTDFAGLWGH